MESSESERLAPSLYFKQALGDLKAKRERAAQDRDLEDLYRQLDESELDDEDPEKTRQVEAARESHREAERVGTSTRKRRLTREWKKKNKGEPITDKVQEDLRQKAKQTFENWARKKRQATEAETLAELSRKVNAGEIVGEGADDEETEGKCEGNEAESEEFAPGDWRESCAELADQLPRSFARQANAIKKGVTEDAWEEVEGLVLALRDELCTEPTPDKQPADVQPQDGPQVQGGAARKAGDSYLVARVQGMTKLGRTRFNEYVRQAGVTLPNRGEKDHRYSDDEIRRILGTIIDKCGDDTVVESCKAALENLGKITS